MHNIFIRKNRALLALPLLLCAPKVITANSFQKIPDELIQHILSFLEPQDLFQCEWTDQRLRSISYEYFVKWLDAAKKELAEFIKSCQSLEDKLNASNQNVGENTLIEPRKQFFANQCKLAKLLIYYHKLLNKPDNVKSDRELQKAKERLQSETAVWTATHYAQFDRLWPEEVQSSSPFMTALGVLIREKKPFEIQLMVDTLVVTFPEELIQLFKSIGTDISGSEVFKRALAILRKCQLPEAIALRVLITTYAITSIERNDYLDTMFSEECVCNSMHVRWHLEQEISRMSGQDLKRSASLRLIGVCPDEDYETKFRIMSHLPRQNAEPKDWEDFFAKHGVHAKFVLDKVKNIDDEELQSTILQFAIKEYKPKTGDNEIDATSFFEQSFKLASEMKEEANCTNLYIALLSNPLFPSTYHLDIFEWTQKVENQERKGCLLDSLSQVWKSEDFNQLFEEASNVKDAYGRHYAYMGMLENVLFPGTYHLDILEWVNTIMDQELKSNLLDLLSQVWKSKNFNRLFQAAFKIENEEKRYEVYKQIFCNPQFMLAEHLKEVSTAIEKITDEKYKVSLLKTDMARSTNPENLEVLYSLVVTLNEKTQLEITKTIVEEIIKKQKPTSEQSEQPGKEKELEKAM